MPRVFARRAALVVAALGILSVLPDRALAVDHLLITEFANTPTAGEFVEIFNPTGDTILLDDFYLTDMVFYGNATGTPPRGRPSTTGSDSSRPTSRSWRERWPHCRPPI